MIDRHQEAQIRRLFFAEHWKKGTIAAQLGVHHDVVERAIGPLGPKSKTGPRDSALDPYKDLIDETLERYPRVVATRLFDMACERGYTGSLRTVRRYVGAVRPRPRAEAFLRTETLPGEQSQIDWAHVGKIRVPGGERALWIFVLLLGHSRALWAELVFEQTVASLRRSLLRAAEYFGGVTRQWLFDNPKTVVLERHGDIVRYQPELLELCSTMHVEPRLCGVRKPNHKGGVERAIRFLKERFFAARAIHDREQGNQALLDFLERVAMTRPHPVQSERTVGEVFEEEKKHLLTLPETLPPLETLGAVSVDKTASVRFDTNRYSVPPEHVRKTLTLAATDTTVRLLEGSTEVARHDRCWGRRQTVEDPAHRAALLEQKRAARDGKGRDRLRAQIPRIDELLQCWADEGRNMGSLVARTLKLLDFYGAPVVNEAVDELLERGSADFGALTVLCERKRTPHPSAMPVPLELADHVHDREVLQHDLGGYDD